MAQNVVIDHSEAVSVIDVANDFHRSGHVLGLTNFFDDRAFEFSQLITMSSKGIAPLTLFLRGCCTASFLLRF